MAQVPCGYECITAVVTWPRCDEDSRVCVVGEGFFDRLSDREPREFHEAGERPRLEQLAVERRRRG